MRNFLKSRFALYIIAGAIVGAMLYDSEPQDMSEEELLSEIFDHAVNSHVSSPDPATLEGMDIDELLSSLDPHSRYHPPEEYRELLASMNSEFAGIGIELEEDQDTGYIRIITPIEDSPAETAGLQSGDIITHVDGASIKQIGFESSLAAIRGDVGTDVSITVRRAGLESPLSITITRAMVKQNPVTSSIIDNDIGYVRLSTFNFTSEERLREAIENIEAQGGANIRGYVIDLRGNPGGTLDQAVDIADDLLNEGRIVSVGTGAPNDRKYVAEWGDITNEKPIVVLTNGGSASASEIVAGALQDHERATILGTRTYGKGSVQSIIPLRNGGALRLTTKLYFTPSGDSIQGAGITPDIRYVPQSGISQSFHNEAANENTLENPHTGEDDHQTTHTCTAGSNVDIATIDSDALFRSGNPDYQLLCAVDQLRGTATYTVTEPVPAMTPDG